MKGFFITGTDTDVGKTLISSGLAAIFKEKNMDIGVYKPLLSGASRYHPNSDTSLLKEMAQTKLSNASITPFQFKEPLAPYVAAKLEGRSIYLEDVVAHWKKIQKKHDYFIVEGAGGISVPLGEDFLVSHLIQELQLPIIIVARSDLGTFNHTFLTVQYAKEMKLNIAGIIINGIDDPPNLAEKTNPNLIESFCKVPILGILPKMQVVDAQDFKQIIKDNIDTASLIHQMQQNG
ncbi:dethiobiotin synthase [Virgibacillus alimentarius]|uniref:ATP-dependent dethiobiotin synthetase BioD n=1 Tax=Virgibacillus alimentarius TaxID=698769 RepID=A0ABS4S764_9BACI|nr:MULTISPECIES: dethiobiotin synthase [Virgibacillus]MBP2256835.1 dethiobiotin synthetase [Virgibacillus alimentarius]HLR69517.1 dethiobiotin synthase [Virgibacillus sp.]